MPEESELIDVARMFPELHIDLKYATADNLTGRPIYQERCVCCIPMPPPRWRNRLASPRSPD
ncbi:D-alanyl-D-alanine dipeptidase [Enterobacter cloacae]|uniref:D-alanyl-D-alanine dipeptidase n=1 Tax=Enterobacter cloacae TaxID=550 RepID=A0A377M0F6_ENTCL|nr:D-alanyl-D-alanine dipeptidase [Enterobacter cloacae]